MPKAINKALILSCSLILMVGCTYTKDVKVRSYAQDKVRVDQQVQGTVGNWQGAPAATADPDRKRTRKVYVLEFTKDAEQPQVSEDFYNVDVENDSSLDSLRNSYQGSSGSSYTGTRSSGTTPSRNITLPSFDDDDDDMAMDDEPVTTRQTGYQQYTVAKDDTLQKISKKFYNSYSKWPRIYEANKDKIKNPDAIKPGIKIRIPME